MPECKEFKVGSRVARDHKIIAFKTGTVKFLCNVGEPCAAIEWDDSRFDQNHNEIANLYLMKE